MRTGIQMPRVTQRISSPLLVTWVFTYWMPVGQTPVRSVLPGLK